MADYVAQDSPTSAHRLVSEIFDRTENLLGANPRAGRLGRVHGTHELVISRTPYLVVYQVNSQIDVLAVIHAARDWSDTFG
ncbi:type II toxin-antitoxin system RelE/ParE family toxin [Rhizobium sp. FY34]|uniref:type II toxin-antitoxin system RelE/ParE family toxin n=1 Tax=Rhizobium sp. FY34 TaxID=2562309 RepID=UPI0024849F2A|nr:type II toxin-antitoxin system RelE/ParE family toxin [Rhizobium sp. FY34]